MRISRFYNYFVSSILLLSSFLICGQDQKQVDSLLSIYNGGNLSAYAQMDILEQLAYHEVNDLEASLKYANDLVEIAMSQKNYQFLFEGYLNIGNTHRLLGNMDLALDALFKSTEAAKQGNNLENEAISYISIADMYSEIGNSDNAELYYEKGISISRKIDEPITLAKALFNSGDEYFNNRKYKEALANYQEATTIFKIENYTSALAYTTGSIGMVYAEQGRHQEAESKINEAINILEDLEDYNSISEYLTYMSDIYVGRNDIKTAILYAERSLQLASQNGIKKQLSESNLLLSELHEKNGNSNRALDHYRAHIIYKDSIINLENVQKAFDIRTSSELSQQKKVYELQKKNQRIIIWSTIGVLSLISLLAFNLFKSNKFVKATNKIIAHEKERSEALLLNILPEETANELKEKGKVKAQKYDSVTVLFTDFKGFTSYAENLAPEKLVEAVDYYFSHFDKIMEDYGIEKIKTIGDAYMCASGLNDSEPDHAHRMVKAAIAMEAFVNKTKHDKDIDTSFDIRIGISTGSVVAGVVGTKKFAYDIWGDTVNVASRMESNSEPGKINISHDTYSIVKDSFKCEYRGHLAVKNRGEMKMYFVNSLEESV